MTLKKRPRSVRRTLEYDEAIITSMVRYNEADCIVRLFCRKKGVLSAFVKNGLKPSKSRGSVLQAPARAQVGIFVKPQAQLYQLVQVEMVPYFFSLSRSLRLWGWAAYLAEITELLLPELDPASAVFDWLDTLFISFSGGKGTAAQLRAFEIKLLDYCGYLPDISDDITCSSLQLDDTARKTALYLLNSALDQVSDCDELVLRQVAKIFWSHLRSFHKGSLRSIDFLKSAGV